MKELVSKTYETILPTLPPAAFEQFQNAPADERSDPEFRQACLTDRRSRTQTSLSGEEQGLGLALDRERNVWGSEF